MSPSMPTGFVAAAEELEAPPEDVAGAVAGWGRRRDLLLGELAGLPVVPPHGGRSTPLNCAAFGLTGAEASDRLLARAKVAATPMDGWGDAGAARYLRLVFANEPAGRLRGLGARVRAALAA